MKPPLYQPIRPLLLAVLCGQMLAQSPSDRFAHPCDPEAPHNGAWFLVRKLDGTYAHGTIHPEGGLPAGQSLHGVRTIIESPFPEERGKVWYFAGHCVERRHFHNTAWINKATIKNKP